MIIVTSLSTEWNQALSEYCSEELRLEKIAPFFFISSAETDPLTLFTVKLRSSWKVSASNLSRLFLFSVGPWRWPKIVEAVKCRWPCVASAVVRSAIVTSCESSTSRTTSAACSAVCAVHDLLTLASPATPNSTVVSITTGG